jgi:hypothetical protein
MGDYVMNLFKPARFLQKACRGGNLTGRAANLIVALAFDVRK